MKAHGTGVFKIVGALVLLSGLAAADQVTLGDSKDTHNVVTYASFTGMHADTMAFSGTCGTHADCIVGYAYEDASVGQYQLWIVNGDLHNANQGKPELGTPNSADYYDVISNGATFHLKISFGAEVLTGLVTLDGVQGGSHYPEALGILMVQSVSGPLFNGWNIGANVPLDFTINLANTPTVDAVWSGSSHSTRGAISSGEIAAPTPEPASLALLGSGIVTFAGILRRRMKF
jgi:hypothetical protein